MAGSQQTAVRAAQPADFSRLRDLESLCWPMGLRVADEVIRQRVSRSTGQFVIESAGQIWGVIYSQRIRTADQLAGVRFDNVDELRHSDGPTAHVLSLNIDPEVAGLGYGDELLEHLLVWYQERGLDTVVGVTRCKDYAKNSALDLSEYVTARNSQGRYTDSVLRMHQLHGAEVRRLVPGYRPADLDNNGNGVLVEYRLADRCERINRLEQDVPDVLTIPESTQLYAEVLGFLTDRLDGSTTDETLDDLAEIPLFELGLDSADLLELQAEIETAYGVRLAPLFFFEHDTGARIINYLEGARVEQAPISPVQSHSDEDRDIAIVGMSCRLPGGIEHYTDLWELLADGGSAIGSLPDDRWQWPDDFGPATHPGIDRGGFVVDADCFEAPLFRVSPNEAKRMDPQQRWILELTWSCLEDAGYSSGAMAGESVGVFIGASGSDYQRVLDSDQVSIHAHSGLATSMAIIANRVSYFYDLRGPSVQVDTACSSSMVAVHSAVRALRNGDCDAALVGGVNVLCHPANSIAYYQAGMLSPDGLCKTFDESANGYVRSEGGVVLLLKRLSQALSDGDHVHAVIKGTATNHAGQAGGLTVPSANMQASLVSAALADARVAPSDVSYIEAHGTGTALGDPIEVQGLTKAFVGSEAPCGLGSIKTNLGHLEAAAGVVGLMKTVLSLQHNTLPGTVHFDELNSRISLDGSPFFVVAESRAWEGQSRMAGVSSFGSGGSNAHVIVAEPPPQPEAVDIAVPPMIVLSAATEELLLKQAERLRAHIAGKQLTRAELVALAYTLQVGREPLRERLTLLPADAAELQSLLADVSHGRAGILRGSAKRKDPVSLVDAQYRDLLAAWVDGAVVDWAQLYTEGTPRRVPLPTHVFAKKHYWLDKPARHTWTFTGNEAFLRDHLVGGEKVLPAVVQLELARAALPSSSPDLPLQLRNVVWSSPFIVADSPKSVHIGLKGTDEVRYEIHGDLVYSSGTASRRPVAGSSSVDIEALKSRMTGASVDRVDFYDALRAAGLDYGPTHRSVRNVRLGDGELLAYLEMPESSDFRLHPGLLDGALQAVYTPRIFSAGQWTAALPFALDLLEVLAECPRSAYVWARETVSGWDLDLTDEHGKVFARLRGYSVRGGVEAQDVTLLRPTWSPRPAAAERVEHGTHLVLAFGFTERLAELRALAPRISFIAPPQSETLAAYAVELLNAVKGMSSGLVQVLVADSEPWGEALSGLLKSAHLERPGVVGQVVVAPADWTAAYLVENLLAENGADQQVRYHDSGREVLGWEPADQFAATVTWRPSGVYLITGGMGGLGLIFAEELARCAPGATLILTGRSPVADSTKLDALRAKRMTVEYHVLDVTDVRAVTDLVADIKQRLGAVHGVIHNAGVLRDGFLLTKTAADLEEVLRPKVDGALNLDQALTDEHLDFFVLSSSVMGVLGNVGQADYAVANAFLDVFARQRDGRTVSINWPLWENGGMQVDAASQTAFRARTGLVAMQTQAGLAAFHLALASGERQVLVAVGQVDRLRTHLEQAGYESRATAVTSFEGTVAFLKETLSGFTGLSVDEIDEDEMLGDYGMDSILATQMIVSLEKSFGSLPKTLFFERHTLSELGDYFVAEHQPTLTTLLEPVRPSAGLDIAIIGLSGRYPEALNPREYWRNLRDGRDCVVEVPKDRWDWREHYTESRDQPGRHYSKWGGFIAEVDQFDPLFFAISPFEADHLDPQERLFLEHAWTALEDAGYTRADLNRPDGAAGRVGVYAGAMWNQYQLLFGDGNPSAIGSSFASVANRVSFVLNLHGPSMTVDTMCSSSLTAIDLACRDLVQGRTKLAFAGGVNVTIHPNKYLSLSAGQFISSMGHCESFGLGGDGYIPGEGVGVVLLKPLADAERDGDHIYAVIKGSGVSHGGRTNGYTVPNPRAQEIAIRGALEESAVDPRAISYVEAHGTGTKLGDPIEISGLRQAFDRAADGQVCYVGSAKSNIGHCESAAGIAGLTKVLLQLRHGQIAPSLHSAAVNPNIDFTGSPFVVNQELRAWERQVVDGRPQPRIAGVSSFGAGGSNAHLVVAEHVDSRVLVAWDAPLLFPLSAKNEDRLRAYADELLQFVRAEDVNGPELAFTLQVGREAMDERLGIVASSIPDLVGKLQDYLAGRKGVFQGNAKGCKETRLELPADMRELAELWVRGVKIDWGRLYGDRTPGRISAPTYPFARERHWVPEAPEINRRVTRFLDKAWVPAPLVLSPVAHGKVAIVHDSRTVELAEALARLLDDPLLVRPGDGLDFPVSAWVDLSCSVDTVSLLQNVIEAGAVRLLYVTQGLEAFGTDQVNLAGAARVGLYRMLQSEYGRLTSRHVDMDPSVRRVDELAAVIHRELSGGNEVEVCHRDGVRYAAVLAELPPGEPTRSIGLGGVLLITGGTRGLGMLCARHFVENYGVRKVVLTGREPFPVHDSLSPKVRAVRELEARGVEVRVLALRLDRADEVRAAVADISSTMGKISGVVHAAGLVDTENPAFVRKPVGRIAEVASPKIEGTENLLRSLDLTSLEFVLLFSSVSAVIPSLGAGQSDYAMGNAYLDYAARAAGAPVTSVQWPSWRETGFGEVTNRAYTDTGLLSISDKEGLALLDDILATRRSPVVMPVIIDPDRFDAGNLMHTPERQPTQPQPSANESLVAFLSAAFESELKLKPGQLDDETPYADYGADSILLAQILQKLRQRLGVQLDPAILLENPTLAELTRSLQQSHPKQVADRFSIETSSIETGNHGTRVAHRLGSQGVSADLSVAGEEAGWLGLDGHATRVTGGFGAGGVNPGQPVAVEPAVGEKAARIGADRHPMRVAGGSETLGASAGRSGVGEEDHRFATDGHPANVAPRDWTKREPVAVIGMACRLPGAPDVDAYWELLSEGRSAISEVPQNRWGVTTRLHAGLIDTRAEIVRGFDSQRFLLRPEDVRAMDPQALVLLQECLNAVHHAGYQAEDLSGSTTGVYVGARGGPRPDAGLVDLARNPIMTVGQNYLAANVSQFFDWQGPAMVLDTACSSSLVAMKVATDALAAGSVDLAVVAGVSLLAGPDDHELFRRRGLLQPDGQFHIFDRRASGVVLGEGAGVVILKPLSQAERDGDTVYAVLEGIAVNNDGRTAGPATPNVKAQRSVMRAALDAAGCGPEQVRHLDVNGSGSETTDLLELKAIETVYRDERTQPLYLGSMKPNIGHPLCAEGVAAFIKVALMVHHQRLVPFLSAREPMEHYAPENVNLVFPRLAQDADLPYAAVSSFADGGTNAHVILGRHAARPTPRDTVLKHGFKRSTVWGDRIEARHPIMANHRVYGQRLLPGLAWIDLLYQWFAEIGVDYDTLELRDLVLHRPLVADPNAGQDIRIEARSDNAGNWRVTVDDPALSAVPPFVTAEMRRISRTTFDERAQVDAITGEAHDFEQIYSGCRERELVHTGLMKANGTAYTGTETWISITLEDSDTGYLLHPALIDASAVAATEVTVDFPNGELFLPLFYESFRASAPLRNACHTRVRRIERGEDLLTFTLDFFDADGHKIGELVNFRSKLVRHAGLIAPERDNHTVAELVTSIVADHLGVPVTEMGTKSSYYELGLDSVRLLLVVKDLEKALGTRLSPTLLFEHTTVDALARHLGGTPPPPEPAPLQVTAPTGDIAIIGVAGRYPKADTIAEFWENLKAGRDCVTEIPEDRWSPDQLRELRSPSGRMMSRWGGFVDDADCFDAEFFDITAAEAAALDPQERLFLQTCWEAMEDAGYTPANVVAGPRRGVGVYVGAMHKDYALVQAEAAPDMPLALNLATIANRVSHFCDFHGPSMAVDTVCASSLTAVHLAVEGIRRGECTVALAGGVNLSLHPAKYRTYGLLDLHAGDAPPRSFGAGGDGYISAEGSGAVLLKPLQQALADGDAVYAVIKGSAVNHAGRTAGIRVPSVPAQHALVADCLDRAGIDPRTISYVEAHGTGTELGDLMEVQALDRAFRARTDDVGFCALGSVKSGIGHAESAAGISALTSATLQLHHRKLVPLLAADAPNPYVDFDGSPFYLQTELRDWTTDGIPRRAGVSAFGATGAYAHVVLEEAPVGDEPIRTDVPSGVLIPLSAKNPDRLIAYVARLADFLDGRQVDLPSLAYTLQTGRVALEQRVVVLVHDLDELADALRVLARGEQPAKSWSGNVDQRSRTMLLDEDDLRRELVRRWSRRGRLGKVAELWVQGYEVSWGELYDQTPRRTHLPTYPFSRDRHWVAEVDKAEPVSTIRQRDFEPAGEVFIQSTTDVTEKAIQYLRQLIGAQLGRSPGEVAPNVGLLQLGLTSLGIVGLTKELAATVDPGCLPSKLFEHDTIAALAADLAARRGHELARLVIAPPVPKSVLDVLQRLDSGALDLDDAIALLD